MEITDAPVRDRPVHAGEHAGGRAGARSWRAPCRRRSARGTRCRSAASCPAGAFGPHAVPMQCVPWLWRSCTGCPTNVAPTIVRPTKSGCPRSMPVSSTATRMPTPLRRLGGTLHLISPQVAPSTSASSSSSSSGGRSPSGHPRSPALRARTLGDTPRVGERRSGDPLRICSVACRRSPLDAMAFRRRSRWVRCCGNTKYSGSMASTGCRWRSRRSRHAAFRGGLRADERDTDLGEQDGIAHRRHPRASRPGRRSRARQPPADRAH